VTAMMARLRSNVLGIVKKLLGKKPLRRILTLVIVLLATGIAMKAVAGTTEVKPGTSVFAPDVGTAQQVVLVRTANWSDTVATVEALEFNGGAWQRVFGPVNATIGRSGFSQAHREGDGSSPVGVFGLSRAYGRQPKPDGIKLPYDKFGENSWWVSDPESPLYNTYQTEPPNGRWRESFGEQLWSETYRTAYRELVVVDYNAEPTPYAGSAIFMHVGGSKPTSGCIALAEPDLLRIMRWLDPARDPHIVMGPEPWLLNPIPPPNVSAAASVGLSVVEPQRVLDTRSGLGAARRQLEAGQFVDINVRGPGVPADVSVVALNVTITNPSAETFLKVTPSDEDADVSNLNAHAGDERAALVMARVGADGNVRITNAFGKTDLVADLVAIGAPSLNGGYVPIDPLRLVDTRDSRTNDRSSMLGPNDTRTFATNAPVGTVAAIVNLTATEATERTWVASFAADTLFPGTSSVNVAPNDTSANLVIVPLSTDKKMAFKNGNGYVHIIVDVFGWLRASEGSRYVPASTPARVVDTRSGVARRGPMRTNESDTFAITGMPKNAKALVATLTGVNATEATNLRVAASTAIGTPLTSNLNLPPDEARANLAIAPVGADGRVLVYNQAGATDLIVDVSGWFV
jgi:L,D-peptidoglycan transpeptidase YkuD (ErfK/YbiS/YcfS/YnhG family)